MIEKYAGNPLLGNPDDEFRRPSSSNNNMPFCPDKWKLISKTKLNDDLKYKVTCQAPPSYTGGNRGCGSNHTGYTDKYYVQDWAWKCQVDWGPNKCALPSSYCGKGSGYTPESCTNFLKFLDRSDIVVGCGTISNTNNQEIPRSQWPILEREGNFEQPAIQPRSNITTRKPMPTTTHHSTINKPTQTITIAAPSPVIATTTASPITTSVSSKPPATIPSLTTTTTKMPTTTQHDKTTYDSSNKSVTNSTITNDSNDLSLSLIIKKKNKTSQAPTSQTQSSNNDCVNLCNNILDTNQKGTQEAFSSEGKCYEDNCYNNPNSPYFRKPLPQCPENWSFVKRDCKYNVCQAPKNYIGNCPKEMKFYNETIGGQATGITTSFADYYTQKCGLNWGDRKMASSLSYREPVKKQMIQDYLVYNPNVDNKKVLRKLGIMDNVVLESFSTNYSKF